LAVAPDGQSVVLMNQEGYIRIWKPGEAKTKKLRFFEEEVRSRTLSPDGLFAAKSSEAGIEVFSIDVTAATLTPVVLLPNRHGRSGKAWCLAFSRDGKRLAAGFWDGTLRVYDVASSKTLIQRKLQHTPIVAALAEDGRFLAAFTRKDGVQLIDIATGEQHAVQSSTGADVFSLNFTPDGRRLMAGCSDRTARVWSVPDGRPLLVIDAGQSPLGMAWIAERRLLVTADGNVKLWECEIP
jgi:WD40 repeat protein